MARAHHEDAAWYCLQVAPQREITAASALGEVGCGVYCPTRWLYVPRRGSKRKDEPLRKAYALFPGYIFVQSAPGRLYSALERAEHDAWARGAESYHRGVLSFEGAPVELPQSAIDAVVRIEVQLRFVPAPECVLILSIGDRVTVTLGPGDKRAGVVVGRTRKDGVPVDIGGVRRKVPPSSVKVRMAA